MKILMINNNGGGFADYIDVAAGTSVRQIFEQHVGPVRPEDFLIRVNRLPAPRDQVLVDGDRISITPVKIEGASCTRHSAFFRERAARSRQLKGLAA